MRVQTLLSGVERGLVPDMNRLTLTDPWEDGMLTVMDTWSKGDTRLQDNRCVLLFVNRCPPTYRLSHR